MGITMKTNADKSTGSPARPQSAARQPFFPRPAQPRLPMSQPGDKVEHDADRHADRVMRGPAPESRPRLEAGRAAAADGATQSAISDKMGGGQPLAGDVRGFMQQRFGADFSSVRVHSDTASAALARSIGARAFTYRNHLFFADNEYQPGSSEGKQLLAHELAHTLQQGDAVRRKAANTATSKPAPAAASQAAASSEVLDLSSNVFAPSQKVVDEIAAQGAKGLDVRVAVKGLAGEGRVRIRADRNKNYDSIGKGWMPLQNAWATELGGMYINFRVSNGEVKGGYASLKQGGGDTNDWLQFVQKNASLLGGAGLKVENLPVPVNKFDSGKLTLGVTNLKVEVGGVVDASLNLTVENADKPKIDASADISVKGIAKGQLKLDNTQGPLAGQVSLSVDYKSFSGAALVKYNTDGAVDITGKAAYNADKLSGEIQFVSTDLESANKFARDAIAAAGGKENVQNAAAPAPVPQPKAGKKQRALAATGQLGFNLTTWFAGTVNVVVDGKGAVTVIGKIAPPGEIELFKQRDWDKELVKLEVKAYYGLPVVGNLNLFANVSLHALAKLGPAKLYNIEILGTYSTDPEIQKSIQISGSINISAYGGLRLRAEGGAGIEIASHDLKFGVGVNADVGVKAYADARPTIGFRDPGVFYISGTLELVAQPVLGLGGDFFIELDAPWWSPLSDDKWVWPLFSKEWPLTDPIGISASVKEYALGSGAVPEIELKKPEFDPSKFMSNMVDKTLPDKAGGAGSSQGSFKEDGSVPKPEVKPQKPPPKPAAAKPGKKGAPPKKGKSGTPDPKGAKEQQNTKILQGAAKSLATLKGKAPLARPTLDAELARIKGQVSGADFGVQLKANSWIVSPKAGGKTGKGLALPAKDVDKDGKAGKPEARTPAEAKRDKLSAIAEAEKLLDEPGFSDEHVRGKLGPIKTRYRLLTLDLVVDSKKDGVETLHFSASASEGVNGQQQAMLLASIAKLNVGDWIRNRKIKPDNDANAEAYERVIKASGEVFVRYQGKRHPKHFTASSKYRKGETLHHYANKDQQDGWKLHLYQHPSRFVAPAGAGKFHLLEEHRLSKNIRPKFYEDTQTSRDKMAAERIAKLKLHYPGNPAEFLSEAPAAVEAQYGYRQIHDGKARVPVSVASADHKDPIVRHWNKMDGNDTTQKVRTQWNTDYQNFLIMSPDANTKLGRKGEKPYVNEVGLKFRGRDE
jgi:hypothetical protein